MTTVCLFVIMLFTYQNMYNKPLNIKGLMNTNVILAVRMLISLMNVM
jgi:hypothetical protein